MSDTTLRDLVLDALVDAQNALQQARSARDKAVKDADQDRKTILARLDEVSDEGAGRIKEALGKKDWGLDEVEAVLAGSPTTGEKDGATDLLKRLACPWILWAGGMSAEDRGLRLRWSVDADQGARQSSSASHRDIDRGRQPIDIVILGAGHDPGMSREAGVQTDKSRRFRVSTTRPERVASSRTASSGTRWLA